MIIELNRPLTAVAISLAATLTSTAHTVNQTVKDEMKRATLERLEASNVENLDATAREKIATLNALIAEARKAGIDTLKERMTVRTAEVFLKYANWDQGNVDENKGYFEAVPIYRDVASQAAEKLPNFERSEVVRILDEAIDYLKRLNAGTVHRRQIPDADWSKVSLEGDHLSFQGRPVFLADYTWKPETKELTEFYGNQDGFFLMPPYVVNEHGEIKPAIARELDDKPDGRAGFIFLNHKNVPDWAKTKYGPGFSMRETTYTAYDIDNPGARELNHMLLAGTVPKMAGKKYTELGYMLCNEPHFYTTEGVWATGPVSDYTKAKFKTWLAKKHASIADLNALWKTSFASFDDVTIDIPISNTLQGTPKWFDWVSFNMDRVTDWYSFLKGEILSHDIKARVHLKIMPSLWVGNQRNHGIDLEALTRLSGIIGNDAGAIYNHMWGPNQDWEDRYAFDWKEVCMAEDFQKSVSPDHIMFNSEAHFLSKSASRDLFMDPKYARAAYWLAHTHGMNASQTWYWARREDGSVRQGGEKKSYAGSNNQQPRIVNEVASTIMDLNASAEVITAMQRQRKPLRIFYSKTSAINKPDHMDGVFHLYEALCFEGVPIGFATKDIINGQDNKLWDAILVHETEYATVDECKALQACLDHGGTVIVDSASLKKDEYGRPLSSLNASKGTLVQAASLADMKTKAMQVLSNKGSLPEVSVVNVVGEAGYQVGDAPQGCMWKCVNIDGAAFLSIVNLRNTEARLSIKLKNASGTFCTDVINEVPVDANPTLKPYEVYFVKVTPDTTRSSTPSRPQRLRVVPGS